MTKKILCFLMAVIMLLGLCACNDDTDKQDQPIGTSGAAEDASSPASQNTQQPADNDNQVADGSDDPAPAGWNYSFGSEFIEENGIQYIWDRLDENTRMNLGEAMNAIRNIQVYCPFTVGFPRSEAEDFCELLSNCAMYYTYYSNKFQVHMEDGMVKGMTINYNISYEAEGFNRNTELGAKLDEIISKMPQGEFEGIRYLHDYLVLNCEYGEDVVSPFTAYGAICEGKATCQGYADGMHLLLSRAGFETMFATGEGKDTSVKHKWCYVKLSDGHWYVIDPTWDDPENKKEEDYIGYEYLLISDEVLLKDHAKKYTSNFYEAPVADSMDMNFYKKVGYWAENADDVYRILEEQTIAAAKDGRRYVYVRMEDGEKLKSIYEELAFENIIYKANEETGSDIDDSWIKALNTKIGTLTITLKYKD